ncbi:MAG: hypothetical protein FRC54_05860 [bacterium LCO1.1]|uniref:Tetratricopeptide repeat protein n=1 Tax=Candidatus Weimeria bifida TaxID=2599074 RepID=A0A6N7J0B3_9FIRM|nr:hypothetical protein [Candidatus Weimeria bifida]
MGELILCRKPLAPAPFYIESTSLNIYSLEELSWFIFHHTDILESDFLSDELIDWISNEAGYRDLSLRLKAGRDADTPFHVLIEMILTSCGYLTPKEIKDCVREVRLSAGLSTAEKRKKRADLMVQSGALRKGITAYQRILASEDLERSTYGDICHDIGYAYARLFLFDEAAEWYKKAYEHNLSIKSLMQLLFSLMELNDEDGIKDICETYHIADEELERARAVFAAAGETKAVKAATEKVTDGGNLHEFVAGLKSDYIRKYGA